MPTEYYDKKKVKSDPLQPVSIKLPKSVIAKLHKIGEHRKRSAAYIVREELAWFVDEELRVIKGEAARRKAS